MQALETARRSEGSMPGLAVVTGASRASARHRGTTGGRRLEPDRGGPAPRASQRTRGAPDRPHAVTVQAIQADLARSDEVQRVCGEIGVVPVDVLVNNAGLFGAAQMASQLTASSPG